MRRCYDYTEGTSGTNNNFRIKSSQIENLFLSLYTDKSN
jgi:hypothetical protein